jgi:ABC-type branched-subunit amino acid transport system substrate-binding protein
MYPPAARHVLAAYRKTFGSEPTPEVLYGYEAMRLVLDAIRAAGPRGDDRQAIIDRVLHAGSHESTIGRFSVLPDGETTLARYGIDVVIGGRPVFSRAYTISASEASAAG